MTISAILAMSQNRVIGDGLKLPWNIPEDMKFFRKKTTGHPVIMGRKTWESLGKPLPNRTNIVVSRKPGPEGSPSKFVQTIDSAIKMAGRSPGFEEIFIIGGAQIFELALPHIQRIYLTKIHRDFPGDILMPDFEKDFSQVEREDRTDPIPLSFLTYVRRV